MTLGQLAKMYGIDLRTLKKQIDAFIPEVRPCKGSYLLTPVQVSKIKTELGDFMVTGTGH